ncbi:hypothetical protein B7463_g5843, partial [Scytalidium lignicola]
MPKSADGADAPQEDSKAKRMLNSVKDIFRDEDCYQDNDSSPGPIGNRNLLDSRPKYSVGDDVSGFPNGEAHGEQDQVRKQGDQGQKKREDIMQSRQVTDPVTHLPIIIHDTAEGELKRMPRNGPPPASRDGSRASTELGEKINQQTEYEALQQLFPPPSFDSVQAELVRIYKLALTVGLGSVVIIAAFVLLLQDFFVSNHTRGGLVWTAVSIIMIASLGSGIIWGISGWLSNKAKDIWEEKVWTGARQEEESQQSRKVTPESVQWLNSLLACVWPLVNPDLFRSFADTLEDVMQLNLLPSDGKIVSGGKNGGNDSKVEGHMGQNTVRGNGQDQEAKDEEGRDDKSEEQEGKNLEEGMEAEQGNFVNMEVAFAYRAKTSSGSIRTKAKNAHLYLAFYFPGGIKLPVWVEMKGLVGSCRMRLQLTPDPPFFSSVTITFLGQPKAHISCTPLAKRGLNVMGLPILSSFIQSFIDAALAKYVAPESLTVDLKDIVTGGDFKRDTVARGIMVVRIKEAKRFKGVNDSLIPLKKGLADTYVTVGWAKFGKPVTSTRIILDEMHPVWDEESYILVGPDELNAQERLRIQLWDSDCTTADHDLGRVEVDLSDLMHNKESICRIWNRGDSFRGSDTDEKMPGSLSWSIGYYPKTRILPEQLAQQSADPDIRTVEQLTQSVSDNAERKLRETKEKYSNANQEIKQQKAQIYQERERDLIVASSPSMKHPSGILSIHVHEITGLELKRLNKTRGGDDESVRDKEHEDDLPSSYCNIIVNHVKLYKTRTKPKSSKPFFNGGTECFIRDWRTTDITISVRDSHVHKDDPLIGMVHLPLGHLFNSSSQVIDSYPIVGGIGYGRIRVSLVFRSVEFQPPRQMLGWDYGTLELTGSLKSHDLPENLCGLRIKARINLSNRQYYPSNAGDDSRTAWAPKHGRTVCLAVQKRYCSCLVLEFHKKPLHPNRSSAFAILWLKDIPDDEDITIALPVHSSESNLKRAESCTEAPTGAQVSEIVISLKFLHGLSGSHRKLAAKNQSVKEVMECLDVANDNKESNNETSDIEDDSNSADETGGSKKDDGAT